MRRLERLIKKMSDNNLDAIILFPSSNMHYITGFKTHSSERLLICIITKEKSVFIAPKLYESQIKKESFISDVITWNDGDDPYEIFRKFILENKLNIKKVAVDDTLYAVQLLNLMKAKEELNFIPLGDIIYDLRLIKDEDEIGKIRKASMIVDETLEVVKRNLKLGMTEIEIAALLEYEMRKKGSEGPSFETIVGSGPNSSLPHYNAGKRRIEEGDFIVLDFGAKYKGYCSDTTRTICIGYANQKMKEIYNIVKDAQEIGVKAVRPGIKAYEIDNAVRDFIEKKGYGKYFTHRTGHGLGIDVHEEPYISITSETVLKPGMVFSIEPGIYLDNEFGVRIEDIVVVTENGCERLNNHTRELTEIILED